jgi:hypothetical protein
MDNQQPVAAPMQVETQSVNYSPFSDNVNEKPYTASQGGLSQEQLMGAIPEPMYQSQPLNTRDNPYDMLNGETPRNGGRSSEPPPINPSMNNIPDAEKKMGAEHLAKLIMDGYEQLHVFGNKALQFSDKKLRKLAAEGEIDLNIQIPYEQGQTLSASEFVQSFNEQSKDTLTVSREFKKEVTPVLTRVLEKRGAGLTDEQYLAFMFGKDIIVKGIIVAQMRSTMKDLIEVMKEYTVAQRGSGYTSPTATQAAKPTTPPPAPTPSYSPSIDTDSDDFNFQMNEAVVNSTVQASSVPVTGKERLMDQMKKEKIWKENSEKASGGSSYEDAINSRKSGKRGRKPKDYIKMDESQIAEAIILRETDKEGKEKPNSQLQGLD